MASANGIINSAAQDITGRTKIPDPSVLIPTPNATNPPTTVAPTGIIAGAQAPTYKDYAGQQVVVDQGFKDNIKSDADQYNTATGRNLTAQEYDQMINPTTYGARWDAEPSQTGGAAAATVAPAVQAKDYTGQVQDAYQKYLGRSGETAGVDFYNGLLKGGMSMDRINQGFMDSDEYKALHPAAKPAASGPTLLGAPTKWDITPDQTVQGQMVKLLDRNSPYYQQWQTNGAQDAAARGFTGNSSIRDTGIMDSVMRGATPIATSDASTYAKAAGYNADMPNQFAMKNQDAQNQMAAANLSADTQKYIANQSAATQLAVSKMSTDSQRLISQAQESNKVLIANNAAAQQAYLSYVAAVAQIDQNDKMTGDDAKKQAIIHQNQIFNSAMAGIKAASPGATDLYNPNDPISISAKAQADEAARANAVAAVGDVDVGHLLDFTG